MKRLFKMITQSVFIYIPIKTVGVILACIIFEQFLKFDEKIT